MSDPSRGSDAAWSRRENIAFTPAAQIADAAGIAAIGAAFFVIEAARSIRTALPVSLALRRRCRRCLISVVDTTRSTN